MTVSAGKWVVGAESYTGDFFTEEKGEAVALVSKKCATLIVTAVNACKSLNESDPQAVADNIVQMFEALKNLLDVFPQEYEQQNKEWIRDAKAVLSSVGGK